MLQKDKPGLWFMFLVNVSNEVNGFVNVSAAAKKYAFSNLCDL